jgi:threonyl-tRNA synthetase
VLLQVVGEKEEAEGTVNVRTRDNVVHGMHSLESVEQILLEEKSARSLSSIFGEHENAAQGREPVEAHVQNGAPVAAQ